MKLLNSLLDQYEMGRNS